MVYIQIWTSNGIYVLAVTTLWGFLRIQKNLHGMRQELYWKSVLVGYAEMRDGRTVEEIVIVVNVSGIFPE